MTFPSHAYAISFEEGGGGGGGGLTFCCASFVPRSVVIGGGITTEVDGCERFCIVLHNDPFSRLSGSTKYIMLLIGLVCLGHSKC